MAKKENIKADSKKKFVFKAEHFRDLLTKQEYKCFVTGRELTPEVTFAEHVIPLKSGGLHKLDNICLVHEIIYKMKRYYTIQEIVEMSADVIKTHGKKYEYKVSKSK